jgi:DNA-binding beta-propeller fold protein YncE
MKLMHLCSRWTVLGAAGFLYAAAGEFRVPGVNYPAQVREEVSILPGGRALRPYGKQVLTETGTCAIDVSPSGKTIVTSNVGVSTAIGVNRPSITVIVPGKHDTVWNLSDFAADPRQPRSQAWQGLTRGLAVISDSSAWVSEGDSGRLVELSLSAGTRKAAVNLNAENTPHAFSDALVFDGSRNLLMALDSANARVAMVDPRRNIVLASVKTGPLPVALALSTDNKRLYVVNAGSLPGSLSIIDVSDPSAPQLKSDVPLPEEMTSGSSVNWSGAVGIAVYGDRVYVSLSHDDVIAIVNRRTGKVEGQIELRIPGLENYRGITPLGLAYDTQSNRLLVAEAGINAVGVIEPETRKVLGHLPVGWFPDAIAVRDGQVYVASERGFGTGPSEPAHRIRMLGGGKGQSFETDTSVLRRGSVSAFKIPPDGDLAHHTEIVMQAAGFWPAGGKAEAKPVPPVHHTVLIVKGDRSFDEILGDIDHAGDKKVFAESTYARFGMDGYVPGHRKYFSLRVEVTPNHHEIASRWAFADNFYVDAEYSAAGYQRLTGASPDLRSEISLLYREAGNRFPWEIPEGCRLWEHLTRHHVAFRNFQSETSPDGQLSDRQRADQFIEVVQKQYIDAGKDLPQFLLLSLAGDTTGLPRGDDAFLYEASYMAENDHCLGRIVAFLSHTPWWKDMAIFVTETAADGGADHIDSHRTLLLGAGPWFKTNYVSHTNASAPALLRTIFKLLDIPPLNLYDATAGDLLDMFGTVPDSAPYETKPEDPRLFYKDERSAN